MGKYVVAHFDYYDSCVKQERVEADSALEAALSYLGYDEADRRGISSLEDLNRSLELQEVVISVLDLECRQETNPGGLAGWQEAIRYNIQ